MSYNNFCHTLNEKFVKQTNEENKNSELEALQILMKNIFLS